ncbi:MAG TPA: hypothetical protein VND23_02775 [Acidimicrobiales bacterium]|nr:hypothetical protein [Acidimicrobiales bacterium]
MSAATEYLRKALDALVEERDVIDHQLAVISGALATLEGPGAPDPGPEPAPDAGPEPAMDAGPEPVADPEPRPGE